MVDDEFEVGALLTEGNVRKEDREFRLRRPFELEASTEELSAAGETYRRALDAVVSQAARGAHQAYMLVFLDPGVRFSSGLSAAHLWDAHGAWEAHSELLDRIWHTGSRERLLGPRSAQPVRELALRVALEERVLMQCVAALGMLSRRVDDLARFSDEGHSEQGPVAEPTLMVDRRQLSEPESASVPTIRPLHVDDQGFISSGAVYGEQSFNRSSVRARAMVVNVEERDSTVGSSDYPVPKLIDLSKDKSA